MPGEDVLHMQKLVRTRFLTLPAWQVSQSKLMRESMAVWLSGCGDEWMGAFRLVVFLNEDSLSLLLIATPQPEAGGAEKEHRDILQQLAISWPEPSQQPEASVTGTFSF